MKLKLSIIALALAATPVHSGTTVFAPQEAVVFEEMLRVNMHGSYRHTLSGGASNQDDWGAGISLYAPIESTPMGVEAGWEWMSGDITDTHSFTLAGRYNIFEVDGFALYGVAGGAWITNGSVDTWGVDAGAGVEYRLSNYMVVFADYRYRWVDNDAIADTGGVRVGLGFSF